MKYPRHYPVPVRPARVPVARPRTPRLSKPKRAARVNARQEIHTYFERARRDRELTVQPLFPDDYYGDPNWPDMVQGHALFEDFRVSTGSRTTYVTFWKVLVEDHHFTPAITRNVKVITPESGVPKYMPRLFYAVPPREI